MRIRSAEASISPSSDITPPAPAISSLRPVALPKSSFREVLGRLGSEIDRGERTMKGALNGTSTLDARQLIALQAGIYRYTEAVDLAGKLIDRATSGVKTVIQGQ